MANVPSITLPLPFIIHKRGDHSGTWHVALCPCPPLPPANFPGLGNVSSPRNPPWLLAAGMQAGWWRGGRRYWISLTDKQGAAATLGNCDNLILGVLQHTLPRKMLQYMYALLFVMLVAFNYYLLKCAWVYVSINVYVLEFKGWICYHL